MVVGVGTMTLMSGVVADYGRQPSDTKFYKNKMIFANMDFNGNSHLDSSFLLLTHAQFL